MSRIQNILDKAEREGSLLRMRSIAEPVAAPRHVPAEMPPVVLEPEPLSGTTLPPGRVVRDTRLDPLLVTAGSPDAPASEQYRALRMRLNHNDQGSPANVILVTSPGRREGKTLTAANLALTMAQDFQRRVCVVDADLRHSRLHKMFGLSDGPGLSEILTGRASLADALTLLEDQQVTVLHAGRPAGHPAELLGGLTMRNTIDALRSQFDRVIIDAPAVLPLADLGILAPLVDRVVLVVRAGQTTKPAIADAVASIGRERLLGIVLNDANG